jgi:aryl-alcohol dehydrogenase-like predicted oxidoreductase
MQTIELGITGEQIGQLALGAMQMGNRTPEPDAVRILDRFLDAGGTMIDTADCYEWWAQPGTLGGHSEELLGRWLREGGRRDRVFLATKGSAVPAYSEKLWDRGGEPDWTLARETFAGAGAETLREALDGSLRRLGTDHVDLYYVHVDDKSTPLEETLEALAGFVAAGKVRYLGWSNVWTYRLQAIRDLCSANGWPLPVAVQQQHSYLRPRVGRDGVSTVGAEQLDYLAGHQDQTLVAYSPILKGIYDSAAKREGHWKLHEYDGAHTDARLAAVREVAAEAGVTGNQLVLAWLMHQRSPRVLPLIGPRTPEQLDELLPSVDVKLTREQLDRLDTAG